MTTLFTYDLAGPDGEIDNDQRGGENLVLIQRRDSIGEAIHAMTEHNWDVIAEELCMSHPESKAIVKVVSVDWGDAWLKVLDRDAAEEFARTGLHGVPGGHLHIRKPGEHPGGKEYWLEPYQDVWALHISATIAD